MKIVQPSANIIEKELEGLSIYQRIDYCSSVCYQRPVKATDEEAQKFCRQMLERKHFVPLEMAVVHLVVSHWHIPDNEKYFVLSKYERGNSPKYVVSGSIRAFLESAEFGGSIWKFLSEHYPLFFVDDGLPDGNVKFAKPHEIPWQHKHVAARIICSRAISHQLVRHRPASILQESQRYCRYTAERFEGEVSYIRPMWVDHGPCTEQAWVSQMKRNEEQYKWRLKNKLSPQEARGALANDAKTELIIYASLPEWKHILNTDTMRCSNHADPEMVRIMMPLREQFKEQYPEAEW